MKTAHLFAGAGGGLLADLILGHTPVLAVECVESCCDSLRDRADEGWFQDLYIHCGDLRGFDFTPWRGRVDCIAAGFPCQDISCAGKGAGIQGGERSGLVSEVFRAIDDIRPGLVWLENSPNIRTRGREIVIAELVARGYSWKDGILSAADVGAPHNRKRWWCVAANADGMRQLEQERSQRVQWGRDCYGIEVNADIMRCELQAERGQSRRRGKEERPNFAIGHEVAADCDPEHGDMGRFYAGSISQLEASGLPDGEEDASDIMRQRLQVAVQSGGLCQAEADAIKAAAGYTGAYHWSPPDCGICGMVDGMADTMDGNSKQARIKAAGNGQVPIAAAAAWLMLTR